MKIAKIIMALLATILLVNFPMILVRAQLQSHNADAMWVEPSSTVFDNTTASVGTLFNVTVWLNITENVYAYQIGLHYNRTLLACTRAGFTAGVTSSYFAGHTATPAGPLIDTSALGNGSVAVGESLVGATDMIAGPKNASLVWIEFRILIVPSAGNFTSKFDLSTETPGNNYVLDADLNVLTVTPYDGNYLFVGPTIGPPSALSVSISANSTSIFLGQSVLFTSTVTGGSPPYTAFQWFVNSTAVSGATSNSWTYTPNATGSDAVYLNVTDSNSTTAQSKLITVTVSGKPGTDVNGDGRVNIQDVALVAKSLGAFGPDLLHPGSPPSPDWNPSYDINGDNKIDTRDLVFICRDFGKILS